MFAYFSLCLSELFLLLLINTGILIFDFGIGWQENAGNLDAGIERLLNEEKHARLAGDVAATRKAVTDILRMCFEARAWKTLNDQIVLLSKRRGQLKQVPTLPKQTTYTNGS